MTTFVIVALVAWCFFWIIRDDIRTRRETVFDTHADDAVRVSEPVTPVVSEDYPWLFADEPLRLSEAADRVAAILAANEAAREDWTTPEKWGER